MAPLMCGRFTLTIQGEALAAAYVVERILVDHEPRYNIAPSQDVAVLLDDEEGRRVEGFRWGLVPFWSDDPSIGNRMVNARAETVAEKPAYRSAWSGGRRCLVLADGFYEWTKPPSGSGPKVAHWIHMADRRPFGLAGLWERWDRGAEPLFTCTILTTAPNDVVAPIHDRMPVVMGDSGAWDRWVNPDVQPHEVADLLAPYPAEEMHARAVGMYVNRPGNEGPECIEPVDGPQPDLFGHG